MKRAISDEQIAEATRLRAADPEHWSWRALGAHYGVAWSTVRRAVEPRVKEAEKARPRLVAEAALDRLIARAVAAERERLEPHIRKLLLIADGAPMFGAQAQQIVDDARATLRASDPTPAEGGVDG